MIVFWAFLNNQVLRTFLSLPEGIHEKKGIFLFVPAHFEGIWFLIWLAFQRGDSGWRGQPGSRLPPRFSSDQENLMILLKPSISREMKSLSQTHFLQLDTHIYFSALIYVCVYVCVW